MNLRDAAILAAVLLASPACALPYTDPAGDAVARRTDPGADASIAGQGSLPDIVGLELTGWLPIDPLNDPYDGEVDHSPDPLLVRIAIEFAGLVSPPGPLGFGGASYDPTRYGDHPVYGFIEFDVDNDNDTGGEEREVAITRYLANAARFGSVPGNAEDDRLVLAPGDLDEIFATGPQFERTGAEFAFTMCGCWNLTVVDEGATPDGRFDPGDSWIVRGRFFERAQAFACLGLMFGNAQNGGPSGFGLYDPVTDVRFRHDIAADRTTIELVFPITAQGAALLAGQPEQPLDLTFGGGNHFSIEEALVDLQFGAMGAMGRCAVYAGDWAGRPLHPPAGSDRRPLDPTAWKARALVGTAYVQAQPGAIYAWTDIGFGDVPGDVNGDGMIDDDDIEDLDDLILSEDGGPNDADGAADGRYTIASFGPEFSVFDLDYSGDVGPDDRSMITSCPADLADPAGVLDLADISAFVAAFISSDDDADLDNNGVFDLADISAFVAAFLAGCG